MSDSPKIPFTELLKSIPGFFGIRLDEEPKFEVVDRRDDVEIRRYAPALLAEVTLPGNHDEALDRAFDILARYIFGENVERTKLPMTSPVYQRQGGKKLPMTSPVTQRKEDGKWTVSFFLSNELTVDQAPVPKDPNIRLTLAPEHLVASVAYRGNNDEEKREAARKVLETTLQSDPTYRKEEDVYWAQYDAPFVIPFLKKNEAHVGVARR